MTDDELGANSLDGREPWPSKPSLGSGPWSASGDDGAPLPPLPPFPPLPPLIGLPGGPRFPKKKRSGGKIIALGLGVVGLVAGGAFAYSQITGDEQANTPEQAIEALYRAVETGDVIGMAKVLAPGERDVMLDSMVPMMTELSRLDILDKNLDLNKVKGIESKVTDFKATSKLLRPDLAEVRITGGNIRSSFDLKKLPIGDFVRDIVGDTLDQGGVETVSDSLVDADGGDPIVAQKIGDRWYLSLNYTVAEAARRDSLEPFAVPAKGGGVAAKGAGSAEEAVSEMLAAAGRFDVRRMIELLPPDEFAALHDYAGQFIGEAEEALAEGRRVTKINLAPKLSTTKITDDRALVSIVDLPATVRIEDEGLVVDAKYANKQLSGKMTTPEGETITANYKGECLTVVVDGEEKKGCGQKGLADLFSQFTGQPVDTSTFSATGFDYGNKCVAGKKSVKLGMVAVKRDGKWFVSPMRTMFDSMTASMKVLDRKDLDCIRTEIEKSLSSLTGSFGADATDSTFDAPTDPSTDPFAVDDTFDFDQFDTIPAFDPDQPVDTGVPTGDVPAGTGGDGLSFDEPLFVPDSTS